jgi:DNA-binding CsgD family transcriptional regulator
VERLGAKDLRAVLEVARELGAIEDADDFRAQLLPQLRRLVGFDHASLNVISPGGGVVIAAAVPTDSRWEGDEELFAGYAHQNPLIGATRRDGSRAHKFSDFISGRELHRLEIYDLIYRPLEVEHQMAFVLPAPSDTIVGVAINRGRLDFSERDRTVLEAARPFVARAYSHVIARARTLAALAALEQASEAAGRAVVLLDRDGCVQFATPAATRWLGELLDAPLPAWIAAQLRRPGPTEAPDDAVRAHAVPFGADDLDAIELRESPRARARALGLTNREAQVLALVAVGLANSQIALELSLSERTVAKHLEHIYSKLGVTNRTAAAARVEAGN